MNQEHTCSLERVFVVDAGDGLQPLGWPEGRSAFRTPAGDSTDEEATGEGRLLAFMRQNLTIAPS
jgi:hypothetical protein